MKETSPDLMLRRSLTEFGVPGGKVRRFALAYFKKHGCMHCQSRRKRHYRFALCRKCYDQFRERWESLSAKPLL